MEKSSRHGAVQLSRGPVGILGDIVNPINKGATLASIPRRIGSDIRGAAVIVSIKNRLATNIAEVRLALHSERFYEMM